MTREELEIAVKAEQEERVRACASSLAEVLDVYGCELVGVPGLTSDGRVVAQVVVKVKQWDGRAEERAGLGS